MAIPPNSFSSSSPSDPSTPLLSGHSSSVNSDAEFDLEQPSPVQNSQVRISAIPSVGIEASLQGVNGAVNLQGVQIQANLVKCNLDLHINIEQTSSDGKQRCHRDIRSLFKDTELEMANAWQDMQTHIQILTGDPNAELTEVFPKSGRAIWVDNAGKTHTTYLLTNEKKEVSPQLQAFRDLFKKTGEFEPDKWPTFDEHTKGSRSGAPSLIRDTHRLQNSFKCSKKDQANALTSATNLTTQIDIQADLYRAQRLKAHLVQLYTSKKDEWNARADAEVDPSAARHMRATAKNLADKADYFSGGGNGSFDWDAVNLALLHPIDCSQVNPLNKLAPLDAVVKQTAALKEKICDKIEKQKTDQPLFDTFSAVTGAIPLIGSMINGAVGLVKDRTDHTLSASETVMATDIALLGIEHNDPQIQRMITEQCNEALGIQATKMRKDPVEFMPIKLFAVTKRAQISDVKTEVVTKVLENGIIDHALTSGLSKDVAAEIHRSIIDFAEDMKSIEADLAVRNPQNAVAGRGVQIAPNSDLEQAFKNHVVNLGFPKVEGLPDE